MISSLTTRQEVVMSRSAIAPARNSASVSKYVASRCSSAKAGFSVVNSCKYPSQV